MDIFEHIAAINEKVKEYITNEEECEEAILGIQHLIDYEKFLSDVRKLRLLFTAANLQIKFISYTDGRLKKMRNMKDTDDTFQITYDNVIKMLEECVQGCKPNEGMSSAIKEIYYKAISLLISVTYDPQKYNFMEVNSEDTEDTKDTEDKSDK